MTIFPDQANADNIITSGTTLRVSAGTTLVSTGNLVINSGATLNNSGTVNLKSNLNNLNASQNSLGSGTVIFSGTASQAISGNNTIQNLTINNASGVTNNGQTLVNGVLTLTSGRVTLGAYNLTLGTAATIGGAPSSSAMIVATGSGQMRKSYAAAGSFVFPVGDNTGTAEYTPVTLNFSAGSFAGGNYAGVNLVNAAYPGSSGSYLNRYWNISQSGISSFTCNATFQYLVADVNGTETSIWCVRVLPEPQTNYQVTNATLHQLTANALNALGTFTGKLPITDKLLNLTLYLEGLYNGSGLMRKAQNETGDQFSGDIADLIEVELHNSTNYSDIIFTAPGVPLSITGQATINIPGTNSASYFITVKHRNSLETTSSAPISFAGSIIDYAFTLPVNVYGGNVLLMVDGIYTIYGGDVSQDGIVDTGDMTPVDNDAALFITGYNPTDVNGDGTVDTADMTIVDNNSASFVSAQLP
ncbi:MAG: hypothetical protein VB072_04975 [Lentimicrobium sp.]|nr:hypothetical protein [Lentimicrobium sp.]MEA5109761.1 hypothetical protein [Lentimicrobium sp.]